MSFVARLRPELICIDPPWRSFAETVAGLVAALMAAGALPPDAARRAEQAVITREAEASTALLEIGAGVPHARLDGLEHTVTALAVSRRGLYEALPTVAIHLVALVLSPPDGGAEHLRILAGISTSLRSPELRRALLAARDGAEALAALRRHASHLP
jgi:mannitol/fructose-specific phosphotransferase system IIA component (Ntr-type)